MIENAIYFTFIILQSVRSAKGKTALHVINFYVR